MTHGWRLAIMSIVTIVIGIPVLGFLLVAAFWFCCLPH